jgi:hypothetical protein
MTGVSSVSLWQCGCGSSLRVVAESHPAKPIETVEVICPHCGHEEPIFATRIISVIEDRTSPPYQIS